MDDGSIFLMLWGLVIALVAYSFGRERDRSATGTTPSVMPVPVVTASAPTVIESAEMPAMPGERFWVHGTQMLCLGYSLPLGVEMPAGMKSLRSLMPLPSAVMQAEYVDKDGRVNTAFYAR